jgi:transposase, IS605 orfB family
MKRVEKHKLYKSHPTYPKLDDMSRKANNLYNQCIYFAKHSENLSEALKDLDKEMKSFPDELDNYRSFGYAQCAQQILKLFHQTLRGYFASVKDHKKHPDKYTGQPRFPKFRKSGERFQVIFTNQAAKLTGNVVKIAPRVFENKLSIKLRTDSIKKLCQVVFAPRNDYFLVYVIYEAEDPIISRISNKVAAIDIGLSNLATVTFSEQDEPILYRSDLMKINRDFNQIASKYASMLKKTQNKQTSKRRNRLSEKRAGLIEDRLHKISRAIVDDLSHRGVSTVIVGKNTGQKINNRLKNFVQVPLFRLIAMIRYKAELAGIKFIEVNESYTSGTSFLDNELPTKEFYNSDRRKFRGLFLSNNLKQINADVNASFQIMKKIYEKFTYDVSVKYANPIVKTIC